MNKDRQAGQVEDLVEKYHQQTITKEEIIETLKSRKLTERDIMRGGELGYVFGHYYLSCQVLRMQLNGIF